MPIYEYQCAACDHQQEFLQKVSDEPIKHCPQCGKAQLQKMISSTSFQLKGTGWYVTDFRDGPKKEQKPNKTAEKKPTDAKTSTETTSTE